MPSCIIVKLQNTQEKKNLKAVRGKHHLTSKRKSNENDRRFLFIYHEVQKEVVQIFSRDGKKKKKKRTVHPELYIAKISFRRKGKSDMGGKKTKMICH